VPLFPTVTLTCVTQLKLFWSGVELSNRRLPWSQAPTGKGVGQHQGTGVRGQGQGTGNGEQGTVTSDQWLWL
jgi:hypothetical protein